MTVSWIKRNNALRTSPPDLEDDVLIEVKHRDESVSRGYVPDFYWGNSFGDKDIMEYRIIRG